MSSLMPFSILHTIFTLTVSAVALSAYLALAKSKRILLIIVIAAGISSVLSISGFLQNTQSMPPRMLIVMAAAVLTVIFIYRSSDPKKVNINWLIAISMLRLPVEIVLHQLYMHGKVPVEMTWEGWNYDIFSGLSAILLVLLIQMRKHIPVGILYAWNTVCFLLLATIVTTAVLAAPLPIQRLAFDQPNVAILEFPFTLLPGVIVPLVLVSHLVLFRVLRSGRMQKQPENRQIQR